MVAIAATRSAGQLRIRTVLLLGGGALVLALIGGSALHPHAWRAVSRHLSFLNHPVPQRADIVDRNGRVLATSVMMPQLYADPHAVRDPKSTVAALVKALPALDIENVSSRLADTSRRFEWISRSLTQQQHDTVKALGLPGLGFHMEERRVYPFGAIAGAVTGDTDTDNTGISGMERAANARLLHSAQPLTLTLDIRVQEAAAAALRAGPPAYGSAAVVMDMQGQLLGMASWPQIDPADRQQPLVFNRATLGVYELADLSDLFLFAWAQESNSADEFTEFPGAFLNRMGLLQRLSLPFETTAPLLNRPEEGAEFELGRDLAISPLQLAAALTALVNGGEYYPPALVPPQAGAAPAGTRVITQETSARLRAKLAGVPVTGIAQKMRSSGYSSDDLVASAVAIFPADAPRFLVFVLIDDIKYTGANRSREAAARAVARIGASVGIILGK